MKEKLTAILNTLDQIDVHGHDNVQKMCAVQQFVMQMIQAEMAKEKQTEAEKAEDPAEE